VQAESGLRSVCVVRFAPSFRRRNEAILGHDAVPIHLKKL
jgi:hypothetical protein